jgi:hypothetical protein
LYEQGVPEFGNTSFEARRSVDQPPIPESFGIAASSNSNQPDPLDVARP